MAEMSFIIGFLGLLLSASLITARILDVDGYYEHSRSHKPMENPDLYQGDIAGVYKDYRGGMVTMSRKWPNGRIPYFIDEQYGEEEVELIKDAFKEFEQKTCIRFIPRTDEEGYIHVAPRVGCWSLVGSVNWRQVVSLDKYGCMDKASAIHELMHAVGFWHEQSRIDRDDYVDIHWENIIKDDEHNFDKENTQSLGSPYDYESIMHYEEDDFAKKAGLKTITAKKPGVKLGNRYGLSTQDAWQINKMYDCK